MKRKNGFTLIELLAVIVILAIIALIATPIVLNIINQTKESATLRSAEFYLDAVEQSVAKSMLHNEYKGDGNYAIMTDGNLCLELNPDKTCKVGFIKVEVSGEKPSGGYVKIEKGKIIEINLQLRGSTIVEENNELVIKPGENQPSDSDSDDEELEVYFNRTIEFVANHPQLGGDGAVTTLENGEGIPIEYPAIAFMNFYLYVDDAEPIELAFNGTVFAALDGSGIMISQGEMTPNETALAVLLPGATGPKNIKITKSATKIPNGFVQIRSNGYAAICDLDFIAGDAYIEIYDSEGTVYLEKDSGPYTFRQEGILYGIQNINEYENPLPNLTSVYTALANGKEITIKVTQTVDGEDRVTIYDGTSKYIESVGGWPTYFWGNSVFEQSFT